MIREFRVDAWRVQPQFHQLVGPAGPVSVEARSMEVLVALAKRAGEVVSRQELLDDVWGDSFVSEEVLTHAIWDLRRAFGDSATDPRFIQTIPKQGYRLLAGVSWLERGVGETGRYRLLEQIGGGGMGIVFRAEDTRLERTVALKFLPPGLSRDANAKKRFLREARTAAGLDHPNLCTLHEIDETEDGRLFLVMAYCTGRTLKQGLQAGPLNPQQAVAIGCRIAAGLCALHDAGIVHRDVKPSNIMLVEGGETKILDFGLAKIRDSSPLREAGTSLGTPAYMSPEQARGEEVGPASDVWSLGVVLFEMLTGSLPLGGDTEQAIVQSILHGKPNQLTRLRPDLPREVSAIVDRCLRRRPEARYGDARELLIALAKASHGMGPRPPSEPLQVDGAPQDGTSTLLSRVPRPLLLGGSLLGTSMLVVLVAGLWTAGSLSPDRQLVPPLPQPIHRQLTFSGRIKEAVLSPDGKTLAFVELRGREEQAAFVRDLDPESRPHEVYRALEIGMLEWSPDGDELLLTRFRPDRATYLVPRLGGAARRLEAVRSPCPWAPGSRQVTFVERGEELTLRMVEVDSLRSRRSRIWAPGMLLDLDWSPAGRLLSAVGSDEVDGRYHQNLWVMSPDRLEPELVAQSGLGARIYASEWSCGGECIYFLQGWHHGFGGSDLDLLRVEVDPASGRPEGAPRPILTGHRLGNDLSVSRDGRLLLLTRQQATVDLWSIDLSQARAPGEALAARLTRDTPLDLHVDISPQGDVVAFTRVEDRKTSNIFVMPLQAGAPKRLTFFRSKKALSPFFSPDGRQIGFVLVEEELGDDIHRVWTVPAEGGSPRPFERARAGVGYHSTWSASGQIVYPGPGDHAYRLLDPATREERELPIAGSGIRSVFHPVASPDGGRIAFHADRRLWSVDTESGAARKLADGPFVPIGWSRAGDLVYALETLVHAPGSRLYAPTILTLPAEGGPPEVLLELPFDGIESAAVSRNGRRLVVNGGSFRSDAWLVEDFDPIFH